MARDSNPVLDEREVAEKDLDRILSWVRAAESRLALVLPLATAMLGALAVLAPAAGKWTVSAAVLASFAGLLLALSVAFAACASFPRTSGPKGSLIYFGGITTRSAEKYKQDARARSEDEYIDDVLNQCYRNAEIAERKFKWVQRSIACLFASALPWSVALFILYSYGAKP